jgi:hypothetical protein
MVHAVTPRFQKHVRIRWETLHLSLPIRPPIGPEIRVEGGDCLSTQDLVELILGRERHYVV